MAVGAAASPPPDAIGVVSSLEQHTDVLLGVLEALSPHFGPGITAYVTAAAAAHLSPNTQQRGGSEAPRSQGDDGSNQTPHPQSQPAVPAAAASEHRMVEAKSEGAGRTDDALAGVSVSLGASSVRVRPLPTIRDGKRAVSPGGAAAARRRAVRAIGGAAGGQLKSGLGTDGGGSSSSSSGEVSHHDILLFIAPDADVAYTLAFAAASKPRTVLLLLLQPHLLPPKQLFFMHPSVRFAVLSAHAAALSRSQGLSAAVTTPTMTYTAPTRAAACLQQQQPQQQQHPGLGVQGARPQQRRLLGLRHGGRELAAGPRKAPALKVKVKAEPAVKVEALVNAPADPAGVAPQRRCQFRGLAVMDCVAPRRGSCAAALDAVARCSRRQGPRQREAAPAVPLNLLGPVDWGLPADEPAVPLELPYQVMMYKSPSNGALQHLLSTAWAILPSLSKSKAANKPDTVSPSLLASLSSGTPLLLPYDTLASYAPLNSSTAFVMERGESLCAAYRRLSAMPPDQYAGYRARLRALAGELNRAAAEWVGAALAEVALPALPPGP